MTSGAGQPFTVLLLPGALVLTVRFRVGDTPALVQLQAFVVGGGTGYALVGTTGEAAFADAEPSFRSIFEVFRLADDAIAPAQALVAS